MQQTSIEIYKKIIDNNLLSNMRMKVYEYIHHNQPCTASQVFTGLGLKTNQSGRITELSHAELKLLIELFNNSAVIG